MLPSIQGAISSIVPAGSATGRRAKREEYNFSGRFPGFNSTLVRLKESWSHAPKYGSASFQFHAGPIKSCPRRRRSPLQQPFQFHAGPIKRRQELLRRRRGIRSFNSTLVRLKDCLSGRVPIAQIRFQFHAGPIKRRPAISSREQEHPGFNSTLVRLKAYDHA